MSHDRNGHHVSPKPEPSRTQARTARHAFMEVELLTGIAVIIVLTGVLLQTSYAYANARKAFMMERTMRMAAQAQLDRYRAGFALDSPLPDGLAPPNVALETDMQPGQGQWSDMVKITVTAASLDVRGRKHQIALSGYFLEVPPR